MKDKIKHYILVLLGLLIITGGISVFLNNASYNPNFSFIDAISGVTKKKKKDNDQNQNALEWNYSLDDLALTNDHYVEKAIQTDGNTYRILENPSRLSNKKEIILLSDLGNTEYSKAVQNIADYLEEDGYQITIQECSETMMLSLVHAGHFDLFLMSEENENEKME